MYTMRPKYLFPICIIVSIVQLSLLSMSWHSFKNEDNFTDVISIAKVASKLHIPLLVFEESVFREKLQEDRQWNQECMLCNQSYSLTLGVFYQGIQQTKNALSAFRSEGFNASILYNIEPAVVAPALPENAPIYYVLKRKTVVIIAIIFEREGNFWWRGAISSDPNAQTVLSSVGASVRQEHYMKYEGSFEKVKLELRYVKGFQFLIPKDIPQFRKELANSHFMECNHTRAKAFYRTYGKNKSYKALRFTQKAWKLISNAKKRLDSLCVRFWLSSGTLLGYYRQCNIIPYTTDVDIGIFISDYNEKIVSEFTDHGFALKHWFGNLNDSLELSFISHGVKLDIFFFYEEGPWMWHGAVECQTGKKFKNVFPQFSLCWTEFLKLKVRVPCELDSHIEAHYGPNWSIPIKEWDWMRSHPNIEENGVWPAEQRPQVIRIY